MHSVMCQWTDKELIQALCEINEGLNDWELGFVDDIAQRALVKKEALTPRMRKKAEQILSEKGQ